MAERSQLVVKKPNAKRGNSVSKSRKPGYSQSMSSPIDRIFFLQRTIGNQAVQRLIKSGALQTKLRISKSGDKYEQEADRVADLVIRMSEAKMQRQVEEENEEEIVQTKPLVDQITSLVQRQVEEEEEEEMFQAKSREDTILEVSNDLESRIQAIKGGGKPLSESERAYFEPRFGADFSQVRVHMDAQADESARAVNARAYTVGRDVVFRAGQYVPGTTEGHRLLAHELTHVVQQQLLRKASVGGISSSRLDHSFVCKFQHKSINDKAMHSLSTIPVDTILRSPDDDLTISPTDPSLRRVNPIDPSALANAESNLRAGRVRPVSILTTDLGGGTVRIVVDGVHRVQAAINLNIDRIPYAQANEEAVRRVAQQRGVNFDQMLQSAQRFDRPSRPGGGGGSGGGGTRQSRRRRGPMQRGGRVTSRRGRGPTRARAGVAAGAALIGRLIGDLAQAIGDIGIQRRVRQELSHRMSSITQYQTTNPNQGVLVVVMLQEWEIPDEQGRRARNFLALTTSFGGRTRDEAISLWYSTPSFLPGAPRGWRVRTEFLWIQPQRH
jgi:uncharacterized ParB-like nuclease family protein